MKRQRQTHENEEMKRKREDHSEHGNEESEGEDRLSDVPDSILLHILSFLTTKEAIQTCILSPRWKHIWKHLPTLTLSSDDFKTFEGFTKLVTQILCLRDSSTALNALTFRLPDIVEPNLLERIVRYAISHDVHQLGLYCHIRDIQPSLFSSHTLKNLILYQMNHSTIFPNNLNLPALTTLNLRMLAFRADENGRADPFSGFKRLKSLVIDYCMVLVGNTLWISNTTLIDLCLKKLFIKPIPRKVDAVYPNSKVDLDAPNLCTFSFSGAPFRNLSRSNLSSLKHLSIDSYWGDDNSLILVNWLIQLAHIKSLTVSITTLEVLFSGPHKLKVKLPSLCNLKILKVEIKSYSRSQVPDEMVDLLLQNAPSAEVCIEKEKELRTQDFFY